MAGIPEGAVPGGPPPDGAAPSVSFWPCLACLHVALCCAQVSAAHLCLSPAASGLPKGDFAHDRRFTFCWSRLEHITRQHMLCASQDHAGPCHSFAKRMVPLQRPLPKRSQPQRSLKQCQDRQHLCPLLEDQCPGFPHPRWLCPFSCSTCRPPCMHQLPALLAGIMY